jgi:hypothetical protein
MGIEMKACRKCKVVKSLAEFSKAAGYRGGLRSRCRECEAARYDKYRSENKEKVATWRANCRANNKEQRAASSAKWWANAKNTLSDSYIKGCINLSGIKIPQELIELKRIQILIKRELRK